MINEFDKAMVAKVVQNFMDNKQIEVELATVLSEKAYIWFNAFKAAGFSSDQAIELVKSKINV